MEVDYIPLDTNHILPAFINIYARREENGTSSSFSIRSNISKAENIYDSIRWDGLTFADDEGGSFGGQWYEKRASTGSFEITKLDTINKIISGTFAFTFYTGFTTYGAYTDSVAVTDGRFDFQLKNFNRCSH